MVPAYADLGTTEIYADYAPDPAFDAASAEAAFTAKREPGDPPQRKSCASS
jgi:hypothetical protein